MTASHILPSLSSKSFLLLVLLSCVVKIMSLNNLMIMVWIECSHEFPHSLGPNLNCLLGCRKHVNFSHKFSHTLYIYIIYHILYHTVTKHRIQVVRTPVTCLGGPKFRSLELKTAITECFHALRQSFQSNARILP